MKDLKPLDSDELDLVVGALHVIGGPVPIVPPIHAPHPPYPLPPGINPGGPIRGKQPATT